MTVWEQNATQLQIAKEVNIHDRLSVVRGAINGRCYFCDILLSASHHQGIYCFVRLKTNHLAKFFCIFCAVNRAQKKHKVEILTAIQKLNGG